MPSDPSLPTAGIPTLEDVAKRAGVSTATVSRCLNDPDKLAGKTRNRVLAAVKALGYAPNFNARALAARRSNTIGAVIPTMDNAIFAAGLQAFQTELSQRGQTLLVASSNYQPELEEQQIRNLVARGADGLLLIGFDRSPEIYRFLAQHGVPALVGWSFGQDRAPAIGFDNRAVMRDVTRQLLDLGHRRIAVISAPLATNDRARERVDGIRDALRAQGLAEEVPLLETAFSIDNGSAGFSEVMAAPAPPTAVICSNDVLAVGALLRAKAIRLRVPEDVSITGFGDIELARLADPPLTTVHVPHAEMGRQAAEMLTAMVDGQAVSSRLLSTGLRRRASLGPPPPQR